MKKNALLIDMRCVNVLIAAELLGISRGLCYRLVHEGTIPSVRVGRRLLVPVKALNAMLDGNRKGVIECPDASEKPQTVTGAFTDAKTVDGLDPSG